MARTLAAGQEAERVKDGVSGVWMISATWDEYGEDTLHKYYSHVMKFLMRFDHYLEMLVWNADIL